MTIVTWLSEKYTKGANALEVGKMSLLRTCDLWEARFA